MANLKKIKLPSGTTYALVDEAGRGFIAPEYATGIAYEAGDLIIYNDALYRVTADISAGGNTGWSVVTKAQTTVTNELKLIKASLTTGIHYRGYTTTALTDGATTNPITIDGASYTAKAGDLVIYYNTTSDEDIEFLFNGTKWDEFGTYGTLKALAFADTASGTGNVSVTGTATAQTFTGTAKNISGSVTGTAVTITPTSANKESITPFGSGGSFTQGADTFSAGSASSFEQGTDTFSAGSFPTLNAGTAGHTYSVSNETLEIGNGTSASLSGGTLPSFTQGEDSFTAGSLPSFTQGTDSYTPASGGTAVEVLKSLPTPEVTQGTFSASYTPEGTNSSSTVSASGTVAVTVTPDNE